MQCNKIDNNTVRYGRIGPTFDMKDYSWAAMLTLVTDLLTYLTQKGLLLR